MPSEQEKEYANMFGNDQNLSLKLKDYQAFVSAVLMHGIPPKKAATLFDLSGSHDEKQGAESKLSDEDLKIKKEIVESLLM